MLIRSFLLLLMIIGSNNAFSEESIPETIAYEAVDQNADNLKQNTPPPRKYRAKVNQQEMEDSVDQDYPDSAIENTSSFKKAFYKTIAILLGGIILVIIGVWFFKRYSGGSLQPGNSMKTIKVLEKRPISPKSMLYLIEVGGQKILISESQFEVRTISELEWLENTKQGL